MSKIENLKKSIRTILDQLPQFIEKYESAERELITEFLAIIQQFEEADSKRETLSNHFSRYSEDVLNRSEYLTTPFLWYTVTVAEHAIHNLSISRFHALEFYKFLLYRLRELYQMMKRRITLSSYEYDQLQTKCEETNFILTSDEFEILKTTVSAIKYNKAESLSSKYIKKNIKKNLAISRKSKRESEIKRFNTLVGGKWWFLFTSSCFGLTRVLFHFKLSENIGLKQIIDFTDTKNTVLGSSNVHQLLNKKNEYIGTLLVPHRDIDTLREYFQQCERKHNIKIEEFEIIINRKRSTSLDLYNPDKGWEKLPEERRYVIIRKFHEIEEDRDPTDDLEIPPSWNFTEYQNPLDIIKLYCKSSDQFSYSQLPFDKIRGEQQYKMGEIGIIRYLIHKNALDVGFTPWRLIYSYSVNDHVIKLPKISLTKLSGLLNIIPYGETYFSEENIYIWTRLPLEVFSLIKNELKWKIQPVVRTHPIGDLNYNWFEEEKLQWIRPKVLQK